MYVSKAASMCFFASSKLLPRTVRDNSAQLPLQLSSSGQKRHSKGTETLTCTFTARGCITLLHSEEPWPKGEITGSSSCGSMSLYRNSDLCLPVYASHYGDATYGTFELFLTRAVYAPTPSKFARSPELTWTPRAGSVRCWTRQTPNQFDCSLHLLLVQLCQSSLHVFR